MKVMKFGGTSVGSADRIQNVAKLITAEKGNIIVLSAMSGTTNSLLEIAGYIYSKNPVGARESIHSLEQKYSGHIDRLFRTDEYKKKASEYVHNALETVSAFIGKLFSAAEEKIVVAQGELMSTHLMTWYLQEQGFNCVLLPALEFMKIDAMGEPDIDYIRTHVKEKLAEEAGADLYITQGFICLNSHDEIDNLKRGGSDYTASLIGAAVKADEIQIWTDIDGMHNNDPRIVEHTSAVRHIHFEEAAELGYFGAKILHPSCIQPAMFANVPVRLLNTMEPSAPGTLIDNRPERGTIKAVAAKDNITAIKIKSSRMLLAHGFLRKVFEIFEAHQTSIDMICTSEVSVSMSIDDTTHLNEIIHDLKQYGTVSVDLDMCIICVVGDMDWGNVGFETSAMNAMKDIPVRMVSYGGSSYNISFLVRGEDKKLALQSLSKCLFD